MTPPPSRQKRPGPPAWLYVEEGVLPAEMRAHAGAWAQVAGDPKALPMDSAATVGGPPEWLPKLDRRDGYTAGWGLAPGSPSPLAVEVSGIP